MEMLDAILTQALVINYLGQQTTLEKGTKVAVNTKEGTASTKGYTFRIEELEYRAANLH